MKKLLLTGAFALASFLTAQAQSFGTLNFDDLTVGDFSDDLTGTTAGQGGFITLVPVGGETSDFQVVAVDGFGNVAQVIGDAGVAGTSQATDNTRYLLTGGIDTVWDARDAGNDFFQVNFDFNAQTVAGSTSSESFTVYDADGRALGGFDFNAGTGVLKGEVYYETTSGNGTYVVKLGANNTDLTVNGWVRLAFSFDPTTGDVRYTANTTGSSAFDAYVTSEFLIDAAPSYLEMSVYAGASNTAAATAQFDNISLAAAATDDNLLAAPAAIVASKFNVFPNPASNVINVTNSDNALVNNVSIVDINGRTVKSVKFDGVANATVNVSDLAKGVYVMTISSDKGATTQKIVKN